MTCAGVGGLKPWPSRAPPPMTALPPAQQPGCTERAVGGGVGEAVLTSAPGPPYPPPPRHWAHLGAVTHHSGVAPPPWLGWQAHGKVGWASILHLDPLMLEPALDQPPGSTWTYRGT